jgi:3-hydroxyacyl-[acyl-carrier-protein] dehydratase
MKSMKAVVAQSLLRSEPLSDQSIRGEFCFDLEWELFKGHFPDRPILPGVVEIELVRFLAETLQGRSLDIAAVPKAKFLKPLGPAKLFTATVHLKEVDAGIEVNGELWDESEKAAEICLRLRSVLVA